jgi:transglutaminase-like putative cysteine protease
MFQTLALAGLCCSFGTLVQGKPESKDLAAEEQASFEFTYTSEVADVPAAARKLRIWIPMPRRETVQQVELLALDSPTPVQFTTEKEYGNRLLYSEVELPAREPLRWSLTYRVHRGQWKTPVAAEEPDAPLARYLHADRLVPTAGFITDVARDLGGNGPTIRRVEELYRYCLDHMVYRKDGIGWGQGDVKWACEAKYGNCSDYHSLFISLCRVRGIPAKFEIGFPLPYSGNQGEVAGYHCWAKFLDPARGWFPVDVSEADKNPQLADYFFGRLHARRVHFTTGRDLTLEPPQEGPPVNFLIYPYMEVDGKEHTAMRRSFSFDKLTVRK